MISEKRSWGWKLKAREARMLCYLLVLLGVAAWKFIPRPWHPSLTVETPHHRIYSSATREQTEETAHALELLYTAYSNRFANVTGFQKTHPLLQVKLFRDRKEFRRINPGLGWAEAFYREPYCRAYFASNEINADATGRRPRRFRKNDRTCRASADRMARLCSQSEGGAGGNRCAVFQDRQSS